MKVLIFKPETEQNGVVINDVFIYENAYYPVTYNFDITRIIGSGQLSKDSDGNVWCEITEIDKDFKGREFYPALGGDINGSKMVLWPRTVSLCINQNCDPRIPSITIE